MAEETDVRAVEVEKAKAYVTVGDIIQHYQKDGYPDRQKQPRTGRTLEMETRNCSVLLKFWDKVPATDICLVECDGTSRKDEATGRWTWKCQLSRRPALRDFYTTNRRLHGIPDIQITW
jgi:hypothetical protein